MAWLSAKSLHLYLLVLITLDFHALTLASQPPTITRQPSNVIVGAGVPASFVASASLGSTFQWLRDNVALENATNSILNITNTSYSDSGQYTLSASSSAGATFSSPAALTVVPPVQLRRVASILTPGGPQKFGPYWVRVVGGLAYVADSHLQIYDVSNPENPTDLATADSLLGRSTLKGTGGIKQKSGATAQ